jgi:hypothetical protein
MLILEESKAEPVIQGGTQKRQVRITNVCPSELVLAFLARCPHLLQDEVFVKDFHNFVEAMITVIEGRQRAGCNAMQEHDP